MSNSLAMALSTSVEEWVISSPQELAIVSWSSERKNFFILSFLMSFQTCRFLESQ